jgi:hypothetical protein
MFFYDFWLPLTVRLFLSLRSSLQICLFIFNNFQDAPPATSFFSCFCIVARGGGVPFSLLFVKNKERVHRLSHAEHQPLCLSIREEPLLCAVPERAMRATIRATRLFTISKFIGGTACIAAS